MNGLIKVLGGTSALVLYISIVAFGLAICVRLVVEVFNLVFSV